MKPEGVTKHFILAFLLALLGYVLFYYGIQHWRTRKGPWQVTFTTSAGEPGIVIAQPRLDITNIQIRFTSGSLAAGAHATNGPALGTRIPAVPSPSTMLTFGHLRRVPYDVPFGKCIFLDTTSLPGTVVLALFGHEIELLPRALIIDRQEHPWRSDTTIELTRNPAGSAATQPHAQ